VAREIALGILLFSLVCSVLVSIGPVLSTSYPDLQFRLTLSDSSKSYSITNRVSFALGEIWVFPTLSSPVTISFEYVSWQAIVYNNGTRVELTPTWIEPVQIWFNNATYTAPRTITDIKYQMGDAIYPYYYIPEGREHRAAGPTYVIAHELSLDPYAPASPRNASLRSWTSPPGDFKLPPGVWGLSIHTHIYGYYGDPSQSTNEQTGPTIAAYIFVDASSPANEPTRLYELPYGGIVIPGPNTPGPFGLKLIEWIIVIGLVSAGTVTLVSRKYELKKKKKKK